MALVAWLIVGLVVGFISYQLAGKTKDSLVLDIVVGLIGSILGGILFAWLGNSEATVWSVLVALITGGIFLAIYHALVGRGRMSL